MTIHRIGPVEDVEPHVRPLGKVLVTTDDLDALCDVLRKQIYHPDALANKPRKFDVKFDGGHFDEISDFAKLSDDEARTLRLRGREVEVVLSPYRAVAIGEKKSAEDIYRLWARSRQTRERPTRGGLWGKFAFALGISIVASFAALPLSIGNSHFPFWLTFGVVTFLVLGVMFLLFKLIPFEPASYAVIKQYTLEEHRRNLTSLKYPRRQSVITGAAACIAAVSMAIAILTFLTK